MKVNELSFNCPTCNQEMGMTDLSLGEGYTLVIGLYCFQCKADCNFGFTLSYLQAQFNALYVRAIKNRSLRPPLQLSAGEVHFTAEQDVNFLTALRIKAD
jgi:hypothetical protein